MMFSPILLSNNSFTLINALSNFSMLFSLKYSSNASNTNKIAPNLSESSSIIISGKDTVSISSPCNLLATSSTVKSNLSFVGANYYFY